MDYHSFDTNKFPLLRLTIPDYNQPKFTSELVIWDSKWDADTIRKDDQSTLASNTTDNSIQFICTYSLRK